MRTATLALPLLRYSSPLLEGFARAGLAAPTPLLETPNLNLDHPMRQYKKPEMRCQK
jgi:hypothetical protein